MTSNLQKRFRIVVLLLAPVAALTVFQLVRIQFSPEAAWIRDNVETAQKQPVTLISPRGRIFDSQAELLATNDTVFEVGLDITTSVTLENIGDVARNVSLYVDLAPEEIIAAFETARQAEPPPAYLMLNPSVSSETGHALVEAFNDNTPGTPDLRGVMITPLYTRKYPGGGVAAQILGFVAEDIKKGRLAGFFGVEEFYDDLLAGASTTGVRPIVPFDVELDLTPLHGRDLFLTLDRDVQAEVERALADAVLTTGAPSGTIVVMNPKTGEILAMASWPTFDPNVPMKSLDEDRKNPAVNAQYEPGSAFKVLIMAGALDAGVVSPTTPFLDTGMIEVGGVEIYNWNRGAWGQQDMLGCMQNSLNVCLAAVATWVGPETFYNYLTAFGIGQTTNVDLASEVAGHLKRPGDGDWYDSDLGTNAFGQAVAVTPLQLVTAISAVANHGVMMQPHVLKAVVEDGQVHTFQPQVLGRPIRPETAATLNEMLVKSLEQEASTALVPGYRVAGKTGTAQIPVPGGYDPIGTIASFVGWLPVDDPQLIILVKLDRPNTAEWGSVVAAPVFSRLAQRLVVMLEIPPDHVRLQIAGRGY